MSYQFIDDSWDDLELHKEEKAESKEIITATEQETCYMFRTMDNEIFHQYHYSAESASDSEYMMNHISNYISKKNALQKLPPDNLKSNLVHLIMHVLRKLSKVKKKITVLEIGSTIGENYQLIKELAKQFGLDIEVHFVGIEVRHNLCQFSNMVHYHDDRFTAINDDASDLSRFPDRCFDLTISQTVANICNDQKLAFAELMRVTRCASVMGVMHSNDDRYVVSGDQLVRFLPRRETLYELWGKCKPIYDYVFVRFDWKKVKSTGGHSNEFIGVKGGDKNAKYEYRIAARSELFPEFRSICEVVS